MHLFLIHVFHHHIHGIFEIVDVQSFEVFVIKRLCYQLFNLICAAAYVVVDFIGINNAFFDQKLNQNNQLPIRGAARLLASMKLALAVAIDSNSFAHTAGLSDIVNHFLLV